MKRTTMLVIAFAVIGVALGTAVTSQSALAARKTCSPGQVTAQSAADGTITVNGMYFSIGEPAGSQSVYVYLADQSGRNVLKGPVSVGIDITGRWTVQFQAADYASATTKKLMVIVTPPLPRGMCCEKTVLINKPSGS